MVSTNPQKLRANIPKIMFLNSSWMFLLIMPVVVPFLQQYGLGMQQIFELQTIFALCVVLFEVPSGYLADLFGRRRSLIAAGVFHGLAFTILANSESFSGFVAFEICAALGNSLFSGSDVALLYDSKEALGESKDSSRVLGRKLFWAQVGETVAAPIGGILALSSLAWPAMVNAVICWVPLCIALTLVEPKQAKLDRRHHENFRELFRVIFRTTPILRHTMLTLVTYGLATLLAVWTFQGYWRSFEVPLVMFGLLWAAYNLVVALVGRYAHDIELKIGPQRVVAIVGLLPIIGYGGMAFFAWAPLPTWLAVSAGVLCGAAFQVGRGLNQVVIKGALNARVPAELRATANSLSSLGVRILFAGLGPALGWSIDRQGYNIAFAFAALLFVLLFAVLCLPLVREIGAAEDS